MKNLKRGLQKKNSSANRKKTCKKEEKRKKLSVNEPRKNRKNSKKSA
jgi:hypothetical protein